MKTMDRERRAARTGHAPTAIEAVVHAMCQYIEEHADEPLTLAALARKSGYSPAHLQRRFTTIVGSSPKAYHAAARSRRFKHGLKRHERISDAMYDAGYGGPSRVYETLDARLGMTPAQYRAGGGGLRIHYAASRTALGWMIVGATERGICFLKLGSDRAALERELAREFPNAVKTGMPDASRPAFRRWIAALNAYLAGKSELHGLPLDIRGTAFQLLVWRYLLTVPSGDVRSYGQVASAIGRPRAVRAVASACARNRVALIIPCHRVIRGTGALGGYRWGVKRKRALLDLERAAAGR
jgi:AraC family transcriptional regulator, regulatory protein of adaptative response / methylated-DNA-[protein]-cysteine methyltransferase